MHVKLLLVISGLAQHAFAFIPYKHKTNVGLDRENVDHHSVRRSNRLRPFEQKAHVKRENDFNIDIASTPSQPNSVGINYDEAGDLYFVAAKFGTSDKVYQLLIDTGATESWIMGSSCEAKACSLHTTLGPKDSTTLKVLEDPFSKTYGSGSVDGTLATDDIKIAGFEVSFTFGLVSNITSEFEDFAMDGLLGLGRAGPSSSQTAKFLDVLSEDQLISAKLYGIHLARKGAETNDGELNFGVPNTDRYDGDLTYTNVIPDSEFWEIPMEDFRLDDNSLDLGTRTAIIDSGSSFIIIPPADAEKLHDLIPGSGLIGDEYTIPCDTTKTVQMSFSGKSFDISSADYVGPIAREGDEETCLSNFIAKKVLTDTQWVVGAVFMRNVYSVFDLDEEKVGFGVKSDATTENQKVSDEKDEKDDKNVDGVVVTGDTENSEEGSDDEDGASSVTSSSQNEVGSSMLIYPITLSATTSKSSEALALSATTTYTTFTTETPVAASSSVIFSTAESYSSTSISVSPSPPTDASSSSSFNPSFRSSLVTIVLDEDGQPLTNTAILDDKASPISQGISSATTMATDNAASPPSSTEPSQIEQNVAVRASGFAHSYLAFVMAMIAALVLLR